ncbi:UNVERIFIED_ORG: uncharacterized protein DUF3846 [Anoxybacillus amylolyticus]
MKQEMIRVLVKKPFEKPYITEVRNTLVSFQSLVEGRIEVLPLYPYHCCLICNEEGKLEGLAPNLKFPHDVIVGTVVFVGEDEAGNFISLTEEQCLSLLCLMVEHEVKEEERDEIEVVPFLEFRVE